MLNTKTLSSPIASASDKAVSSQDALSCDVLVIGAGLAGLSTALSLPNSLQIIVLAKADLTACSSHYAQGGIAAVIDADDSVIEHVSDTLIAGDGLCDVQATTDILAQGGQAIEWLLQHRVPFTTNRADTSDTRLEECHFYQPNSDQTSLAFNPLACADLHLTQEGGHGRRRVAHADDATGRHIMDALTAQASVADNITLMPFCEALSLVTVDNDNIDNIDSGNADNGNAEKKKQCQGATVFNRQTQTQLTIKSQTVVLASGGLGQLFNRATAPEVCVGDGMMMAWEAGCRLANMEFVQFHPTGLVTQGTQTSRNFLISEAVRGEGGYLLDPITHTRFMPTYDKRAELAPRDIVARAIANESHKNGLGYVHLDISHQPSEFIRHHFPDIYAHCLNVGIDITTDPIPVAPTAHYTCGGVMTTINGQTDIAGLYAAGEVAHTGLHGANRLASNSLLECVVVGRDIAEHLPKFLANKTQWQYPDSYDFDSRSNADNNALPPQTLSSFNVNIKNSAGLESSIHDISKKVMNNYANTALQIRTDLKKLMTHNMGIKRDKDSLANALAQVQLWQCQLRNITLKASDNIIQFQTKRLLTLASLLLQSAQTRLESRGGHYRNDYPTRDAIPAISIIQPIYNIIDIDFTEQVDDTSLLENDELKISAHLLAI